MKTKSTGKNIRSKIICSLSSALTCLFVSGCGSLPSAWNNRPITNPSSLAGKTTIVVPIKGPPIALQDSHTGTFLLFGFVGAAIEESVDKPKRDALVTKVTGGSRAFSPEIVLAEECVDILRLSGRSLGTNVTLFAGLEVMHGAGSEIEGETRVFKTTSTPHDVKAWHNAYTQWMGGGPVHTFPASEVSSGQCVSLEVTVESVLISKNFYIGPLMRLMDPVSGKPLASGFAHDKFSVQPMKNATDVDAFVQDYRKCARRVSETLLKQLNLIP